ncbi:MAG: glucose 1-dehydrogenase [Candidatus Dormibacteria bacterium]
MLPHEVRVRTLRVGFCATDREMVHGGLAEPPDGCEYLVLGHEVVGMVEEVGAGVADVAQGDCVVAAIRRGCARCVSCRSGRPDFCTSNGFLEHGIRRLHGFAQPRVDIEASALVKIGPELAEIGFLAEPLSVVEKAMDQVAVLRQRLPRGMDGQLRVVVAGAGAVGLLAVQLLVTDGYDVTVIDRRPVTSLNAELAVRAGATYVALDAADLWEWRPEAPFDLALECSGSANAALGLLRHLGEGGGVVWIGVPLGSGAHTIPADDLVARSVLSQHAVIGTVNASAEHVRRAVNDRGRLAPLGILQQMVTSVIPPADFASALQGSRAGIKVAVEFAPLPSPVEAEVA